MTGSLGYIIDVIVALLYYEQVLLKLASIIEHIKTIVIGSGFAILRVRRSRTLIFAVF